jgi:hypothetical protein
MCVAPSIRTVQDVANGLDGRIEPPGNFTVCGFEARRARIGIIQLFGKTRAVIGKKRDFGFPIGARPTRVQNTCRSRLKHTDG